MLACGVCRTDLHIFDGELTEPKLPLVLGHQIVARVAGGGERFAPGRARGSAVARLDRRRLPLLPLGPREPLRPRSLHWLRPATGATPSTRWRTSATASRSRKATRTSRWRPLLCAGLIGYRTLRFAGDAERIGIYGFGAAAHIICQVARPPGPPRVRVHARGATRRPRLSRSSWARNGRATPSARLPRSSTPRSIFAPVGELVPAALRARGQGRQRGLRRDPHE